ncbi:MAG: hypothetical protein H7Y04_15135 [Verrucomicrobia bacterium]|nr:hypothetical protein [Cytophagales bacterium]
MKFSEKIVNWLIKWAFHISVRMIEKSSNMKPSDQTFEELKKLPDGTLGKDVATCLENYKLRLIPGYESHDLKHTLLDFQMTPVDEIRMQAFMLGNGNYTLPCFIILTFGMLLLPSKWKLFYQDFQAGRVAKPISSWTLHSYKTFQTIYLRKLVLQPSYSHQPMITMKDFVKFGAFASIAAGVLGMFICLPFLFSSNVADLIGAGFPFLAGAILATGGLLALSNVSKPILDRKSN